jgi:RHS repeat-associated protein
MPIAIFTPDTVATNPPLVYYVHTDHLNTPRVVVNKANQIRWRWLAEPFGTTAPETNPASLGVFTQPLRFPGQYADLESGLFFNWNRYLDPQTGRYTQSDPIGLAGGSFSTYDYVKSQPTRYTDPLGLYTEVVVWQGVGIGSSSLGHVSTNVNGANYSWGPGGWDTQSATAAQYNSRQQEFRGGTGVILNLTPQQEAALASCMKAAAAVAYNAVTHNCGNPVQQCLNAVGAGIGNSVLPSSILENLRASPNATGSVSYPSPRPSSGFGGGLLWR